jgi:hypothetical protein
MTSRALALTLALAVALGACGKYGPPVRSAPREQAETSRTGSSPEPGSPETPAQERDREEQEP